MDSWEMTRHNNINSKFYRAEKEKYILVEWLPNVVCKCEYAEVRYDEYDHPCLFWKGTLQLDDERVLQLTIPKLSLDLSEIQLIYESASKLRDKPLTVSSFWLEKLTAVVSQEGSSEVAVMLVEEVN